MTELSTPIHYERRGDVALILLNRPPVNAMDTATRHGLAAAIGQAQADPQVGIVLLAGAGRFFTAGADISEFDTQPAPPVLRDVFLIVERCSKPVAVVVHGTALGGGVELAMSCHYRAAMRDARLGLPEVQLGLIPGAGGTQRLPRLIGARAALEMILQGRPIAAAAAKESGLIDEILDGDDHVEAGLAYARSLLAAGATPRPTGNRAVDVEGFDEDGIREVLKAQAKALRGRSTQQLVLEGIKAAATLPYEAGLQEEVRLADLSEVSAESRALRHLFFAERTAAKLPDAVAGQAKPAELSKVAVVGAGTMGSGIATAFANSGLRVVLIDSEVQGLERGLSLVRANYDAAVARGIMNEAKAKQHQERIESALHLEAAKDVDLVVEAVFEDMEIKKDVLSRLDRIVPAHAILASNTSTLSVTELGRATSRPAQVVGLHFFSPAHVMRLLEIVRGQDTAPETLLTALQVAKLLRKIGVIAGDGYGFIGNRMMLDGYWRENEQLLLEGATPEQVDRVLYEFGFAMGPNQVNDMGGVDVGTRARQQLALREARPDPYFAVSDALTPLGRLGQKTGKGVYRYEPGDRTPHPDPEVRELIERLAAERGIVRREISDAEIQERCVLSLINVGAKVLEEGMAYRASDIDVVWTSGYGFPRHLGGPMFHADALGLAHVLERVRHYHQRLGYYWEPARLLVELAETQSTFAEYDKQRAG